MSVIIALEARNVKRLRAVRITPDGSLVQITGKNAQGKTSVLDAIALGLAGKAWLGDKPIREGADRGDIDITLDNGLRIRRSITRGGGGGGIVVTDADGNRFASPQAVLDKMAASIAFDPLSFSLMKPAEQLEQLRRLVGLDFASVDQERKRLYDERTAANKTAANLKRDVDKAPYHPDAPKEKTSIATLLEEHKAATAAAKARDEVDSEYEATLEKRSSITADIEHHKARLAALSADLINADKMLNELKAKRDAAPAADVDAVTLKMTKVEELNQQWSENRKREELADALRAASAKADDLSRSIVEVDEHKRKGIAGAKFPIEGLAFDDVGVIYQGVPFSQASSAEKLRVSVAMALAMAPELKVLLIRDGSLLDTDNLALVAEMADAAGAQVWIERVESGGMGVEIVDGEVAE